MKITIINGPNLNLLGKRNSTIYGFLSLDEINQSIKSKYPEIDFDFFQSNSESEIINYIHNLETDALIINPAAFTHTSIAIRDALEILDIIKIEVHLSDLSQREAFRQVNYISAVVDKTITGKRHLGYFEAIDYILYSISNHQ